MAIDMDEPVEITPENIKEVIETLTEAFKSYGGDELRKAVETQTVEEAIEELVMAMSLVPELMEVVDLDIMDRIKMGIVFSAISKPAQRLHAHIDPEEAFQRADTVTIQRAAHGAKMEVA